METGQLVGFVPAVAQDVEGDALRGLLSDAWQSFEFVD